MKRKNVPVVVNLEADIWDLSWQEFSRYAELLQVQLLSLVNDAMFVLFGSPTILINELRHDARMLTTVYGFYSKYKWV